MNLPGGLVRIVLIALLTAVLPLRDMPVLAAGSTADLLSDTWAATDALGRSLPDGGVCGPPRSGKTVGIFYFLWLGQHGMGGPYDITQILSANPAAIQSPDSPPWGPLYQFHHWGQPELGYYLSIDPYVIRRHCELLVDAGVDTLIFDVTNTFTYTSVYTQLCSIYRQIRQAGGRTPQLCFFGQASTLQTLYDEFYSQNLYPELWFQWKGKPLYLVSKAFADDPAPSAELQSFFTLRDTWAWSSSSWFGDGHDKWTWADTYPQRYGWDTTGVPEELSVSVALQETYMSTATAHGRHYHGRQEPPATEWIGSGEHFAEQWSRALAVDPEFVFITGWNEWVAQRFVSDGGIVPLNYSYFVDEFSQEYSRDVEPMAAGHTDNYYYQMMSFIRRFKGVRPLDAPSPPATIAIDGAFTDWTNIQPEYWDTSYDTTARNYAGWGSAGTYVNSTGRNDFVRFKVAYDTDNLYFYAETRTTISSRSGANWMLLYIDADHNHDTGWEGFDYLVNSSVISSSSTTLRQNAGGYTWTQIANVSYRTSGNKMEIKVPRSNLGLAGTSDLQFDFKWADNIQTPGDIIAYCKNGDTAPNRRARYRFTTLAGPPPPVSDFTAQAHARQVTLTWQNPSVADFARTRVRFSTTACPTDLSQGTQLADVTGPPGSTGTYLHEHLAAGATYYYTAFACDSEGVCTPANASVRLVPGDFDGDGDVDQEDFGAFQLCIDGGYVAYPPECEGASLNNDSRVDNADLTYFLQCLRGPENSPGC